MCGTPLHMMRQHASYECAAGSMSAELPHCQSACTPTLEGKLMVRAALHVMQ